MVICCCLLPAFHQLRSEKNGSLRAKKRTAKSFLPFSKAILLLLARTNSEEHTAGITKEEKKIKMATPGKCFLLTGPSV